MTRETLHPEESYRLRTAADLLRYMRGRVADRIGAPRYQRRVVASLVQRGGYTGAATRVVACAL